MESQKVLKVNDMLNERASSQPRLRGPGRNQRFNTIEAQPKARFRMRAQTPNQAHPKFVTGAEDGDRRLTRNLAGSAGKRNNPNQYNSQTIGDHSSSNLGVRSVKSGRHARNMSNMRGAFSTKMTVDSTVSLKKSTGRGETPNLNPGPGQYQHKSMFPNGPKYVIQTKSRQDSLFLTKISQNVSPGPGKYNTRGGVGGHEQSIGIRFNEGSKTTIYSTNAGPGAYNVEPVKFLKRFPRATIGHQRRTLIGDISKKVPGPNAYNSHSRMTDRRSQSTKRNAPRCVIGNDPKQLRPRMPTPGPLNYNTISQKEIGDEASAKATFGNAIRPISAKIGEVRPKSILPGPQDYNTVEIDRFKERKHVIPSLSFMKSGVAPETEVTQQERSKSPGPNHYRPQSAMILSRNPSATIGNTKRSFQETAFAKKKSPGPQTYVIQREITTGPKYPMANKYLKQLTQKSPGPQDYKVNLLSNLKKNPRATIGHQTKESCFDKRESSPGPAAYEPKRLIWKKRSSTIIFNREKRKSIGAVREKSGSPGPGSYMIPCKFFDRPRFMLKQENKFKFV